jgi:hypothetical protein
MRLGELVPEGLKPDRRDGVASFPQHVHDLLYARMVEFSRPRHAPVNTRREACRVTAASVRILVRIWAPQFVVHTDWLRWIDGLQQAA